MTDRNLRLHEFAPVKMSLEEYLDQKGLGSPISDFLTDKLRGNRELKTERGAKRFYNEAERQAADYAEKRQEAIRDYNALVKEGKIIPKNSLEKEFEKAKGHPDNPSVLASRKMLVKRTVQNPNKYVYHDSLRLFSEEQYIQILLGSQNRLSLDQIALFGNPEFNQQQMKEIREGLERGLKTEEINIFANPKFDWHQMSVLRDMILNGVPLEDVQQYADFELSREALEEVMDHLRKKAKETGIERE